MTVVPLTTSQPRLYVLDGLRGVCAISLMFYHLLAWNGATHFQIGTFGVYLFYVLSGFSMWYVYAPRQVTAAMLKQFFIARFARIFPLYFLVCLLAIAARVVSHDYDKTTLLYRFILNSTFLFGLDDPGQTSLVPGGWSIGIEWVFYFLFPLFLLFIRRLEVMIGLLLAGSFINAVITDLLFANQSFEAQWVPYTQFPTFFMYFIGGIAAAELFRHIKASGFKLSRPVNAWGGRLIPLAALALIFFYPSRSVEDYLRGPHVLGLVAVSMLALIAGSMLEGITRLEIKIYSFLGEVSYSTYLLFFFVYSAYQIILKHVLPGDHFIVLGALATTSTLVISYLVYRFFEMPARRWMKARWKQ